MAEDSSRRVLLRQALSLSCKTRRAALSALTNSGDVPPASFLPHLIARVATADQQSLQLSIRLITASLSDGAESVVKKKLAYLAYDVRKAPFPTRDALNLAKLAAALLNSSVRDAALDLLVASIAAIEASAVPKSGPQRRSRDKALRTAYRHGGRSVATDLQSITPLLFSTADRYAKTSREPVSALGLLAPSFPKLSASDRERFLVLLATICVKTSLISEDLVRLCQEVLQKADTDVLVSKVVPVLDRALLREPQTALPSSTHFLKAVARKDLSSASGKSFVPSIVQAVKSSDRKTRLQGVALAEALGPCLLNDSSVGKAIEALFAVLKNARYAYQKVATLDAISAVTCASLGSQTSIEEAASYILGWLSSKKESNEEARLSGIRALVKLAALACKRQVEGAQFPEPFLKCATYFADTLGEKGSESDMRSLLISLTEGAPEHQLPRSFIGDTAFSSLEAFVTKPSTKKRHEECLRALTVLVDFDSQAACGRMLNRESKAWPVFGDQKSSPLLQDASSLSTLGEIKCAIRCCSWMVRVEHEASSLALKALFSLSVDPRPATCREARKELQRLHEHGDIASISKMFLALWESFFSVSEANKSVAKSLDFDDGMAFAEKLGHAILATILPDIPLELLYKILLATNHPRLVQQQLPGRSMPRSRFWSAIEKRLEPVDLEYFADGPRDWLESCLSGIFGNDGLRSETSASVQAAVNSLQALAAKRNPYSNRVLRRSIVSLRPLALGSAGLGPEDFEALKAIREASHLSEGMSMKPDEARVARKRANKKQSGAANPRMDQQRQAATDRARAAAANATLVAEKAKAAKAVANAALEVLRLSRAALPAISALARAAPEGVRSLMASMLSLVLPLSRLEALECPCREALYALSETASKRLHPIAVDVASSVYCLNRGFDVKDRVSTIVYALQDMVPPALGAEDFSLISPLIQAAMLRDPDTEDERTVSGRRGSTKRRETIAVVKAAAQVLLEHCKPEAVDAAVAAAGCRAGSWAVRVLEREDGAFAPAADALALLTGTALNPGTEALSQVLEGIISGKSSVRDAALAALARLPPLASAIVECPRDPSLGRSLWFCRFDPDDANAELADELWTNYNHPLYVPDDVPAMLGLLAHKEVDIRLMSAKAIAAALCGKENESTRNICIAQMFTMYLKKLPQTATALEEGTSGTQRGSATVLRKGLDRSRVDQEEESDPGWTAREGVALAIGHLATAGALALNDITVSFAFLAGRGLGDENDNVREKMSKAAIAVVEAAGERGPPILLPMMEKQLNLNISSAVPSEEVLHADRTRENLVMCLGSVASFLPPDDERVEKIANQVMKSAMETPSEVVQNAAARCLAPLANSAIGGEREEQISRQLLQTVWNETSSYGERRGAAYALAGISKGLGLKFMKRAGIMKEIEAAVGEKAPRRRQGAFLLIETHAILLERLFEPYAVTIVPFLLQCMGDSVIEVRNSCWAAAQASMSEISSLGVKMILPSLLEGLKDRQWRTKAGSAEVLGAMAYCAPRQLAQCLPQVVPKLAEALADAHPKVVSAAESAINRIAAVVRSPEVRKLSPFLLAALRDPAGRTRGAIDAMLGSQFVHAIDAASLALLIPALHRGLRDRSSELKKRSAAIVGSMCNNVANHADVIPYLDLLLPSLRVTLLDAIPAVRRTSARALGALALSLGETGLPDIVPWLVNAILGGARPPMTGTREGQKIAPAIISSSAERSGAAMGLAEVSASMNERRLEDVLDTVLMAGQLSAEAREGGLMLIASMPKALGDRFEGRLARALSAVLKGLADDADSVREAALEAGRNLVSAYAKTSLDNLLPELLVAMREKLWRIRQAATRLLGDLLLVIAGGAPERPDIFGSTDMAGNDIDTADAGSDKGEESGDIEGEDGETEEEEHYESPEQAAAAMSTEAAMKVIEEVLGFERRNEVLAALYIIRCDVSIRVRQTGIQVWKSVVANTPRVLREIMPCAVRQIVDGLGDEDEERRAAAGKTLSDLSQKLGDRVVPEVLPALRTGISNKDVSPRIRRGACEGLSELIHSSTKEQLEDYVDDLIDAVYQGLSDDLSSVREVAADVFASLLKPFGTAVVDAVVPKLIARLSGDVGSEEDAEVALDSLKQIMRSSGTRLLAIVVPRLLTEKPLKPAGSRVLAAAALVAENGFEPYIVDVVSGIVESIELLDTSEPLQSFEDILAAIANGGDQSVKIMLDDMFSKFNEGYPERRIGASRTIIAYCRGVSQERLIASCVPLLESLIRQLADTDAAAAKAAWEALKVLSDAVPCGDLSPHIPIIRQSLKSAATGITVTDSVTKISGLQIPKAPAPFVPIFSDGLLNGSPELREQASLAIAELIELTNTKSLGPFVIKFAGPLIRVVSGRFPWQVKAAILRALLLLLKKGGLFLRPFAPQLQSAFLKSLSDNNRLVRVRACAAIGALVPIQPRLEPLLNDLVSLGVSGGSAGARTAAFHSCSQVMRLGKKLPDSAFTSILDSMVEGLLDDDDDVSKASGRAVGFLAGRSVDSAQYVSILRKVHDRLHNEDAEYTDRASAIRAIGYIFIAGKGVKDLAYSDVEPYATSVFGFFNSAITHLQCAACKTAADLFSLMTEAEGMKDTCISAKRDLVMQLSERAEFDDNPVVRVAALDALKEVVRLDDLVLEISTAMLITCAGATNTGIRDAAERVLRKGLLRGRDLEIDHAQVELAKDGLTEEDQRFIDRRIPKLRSLAESDDEKD